MILLKRMYQSFVYGRMMSVYGQIPGKVLDDIGLSNLTDYEARAYEIAYGHPRNK